MKILVTGSCGFIGINLCLTLLKNEKNMVYGIDNFTDNYNVNFKRKNYEELKKYNNFKLFEENVLNTDKIKLVKPPEQSSQISIEALP